MISIEDFHKLDLRVAEIKEVEEIEGLAFFLERKSLPYPKRTNLQL